VKIARQKVGVNRLFQASRASQPIRCLLDFFRSLAFCFILLLLISVLLPPLELCCRVVRLPIRLHACYHKTLNDDSMN